MTKLIECPTCEGEGKIYDRREHDRDGLDLIDNVLDQMKERIRNGSKYLYHCKIPYDDSAKDLIKELREMGLKIRVRGSGERAKYSLMETGGRTARYYDSHLPLKYASHVRLYITK